MRGTVALRGTAVRRVLAGAMVALLLVMTAGPAGAAGRVVVSTDGHTWTDALREPLFDPGVRWVPGDVRTASFYVGNRSGTAATVALLARASDVGGLLARGDVHLQVRRDTGSWAPLAADGREHRLTGSDLGAESDARIEVRASFDPASRNVSELRQLFLGFQVVLAQHGDGVSGPHGPVGALPDTGGPELWVLLAGALLIASGATVLRRALAAPTSLEGRP